MGALEGVDRTAGRLRGSADPHERIRRNIRTSHMKMRKMDLRIGKIMEYPT